MPGLLAVITALTGTLLLHYEPLVPRRPAQPPNESISSQGSTKIESSLFDDPIAVIGRTSFTSPSKPAEKTPGVPSVLVIGDVTLAPAAASSAKPSQAPANSRLLLEPKDIGTKFNEVPMPAGGPNLLILPVFLRPGTDVVTSEYRSRMRSAVIAGLASCGYAPESGKLECCRVPDWFKKTPSPEDVPLQDGLPLDVPLEWYDQSASMPHLTCCMPYRKVLVLWLVNDAVAGKPMARLRELLQTLTPDVPEKVKERIKVWAMGPDATQGLAELVQEASSGGLAEPVQKASSGKPAPQKDLWKGRVNFLSHTATAAPSAVRQTAHLPDLKKEQPQGDDKKTRDALLDLTKIENLGGNKGSPDAKDEGDFQRTILTDDLVAQALVNELKLRKLDLKKVSKEAAEFRKQKRQDRINKLAHVAILSEFDSAYGRALPEAMIKAAKGETTFNSEDSIWHWFSYPRGLDGRMTPSGGPATQSNSDKSPSGSANSTEYKPDEVPNGTSQADALRRLADYLENLQTKLIQNDGAGICAIGLMGGDVYDKLWILRALRPRFPGVIFFTDNLDAWLWQKDELRTTRNLIIASPYALTLGQELQMGKPPFRDSYQTSAYATTLTALGAIKPTMFEKIHQRNVRRYEIGKQGPIDLSPTPLKSWKKVYPENPQSFFWWSPGKFRFATGLILLLLFTAWIWRLTAVPPMREESQRWTILKARRAIGHTLATCTSFCFPFIVLISAQLVYALWKHPDLPKRELGEPFLLFGGASAWPSEGLRIVAILLAVHLIFKCLALLNKNQEDLDAFYFDTSGDRASPKKTRWSQFIHWFKCSLYWRSCAIIAPAAPEAREAGAVDEPQPEREGGVAAVEPPPAPPDSTARIDPRTLWIEYALYSGSGARLLRASLCTLLFFFIHWCLRHFFGMPTPPVRGDFAMWSDKILDWGSTFSFLWLNCFVTDALWAGRMFTYWFSLGRSSWDEDIRRKTFPAADAAPGCLEAVCDYLDVKLVADRTRELGEVTFFPFYVLALLILARCEYFDRWTWPWAIVFTYVIAIFLVVFTSRCLRTEAETLRKVAIQNIERGRPGFSIDEKSPDGRLIDYVRKLRVGAFAPLSEQPVMKAVYWLMGGLGLGGLLQFVSRFS